MANQIVKLKKGSDYLYPQASYIGVDTANVLYTLSQSDGTFTYTATEDCIAFVSTDNWFETPKINDVSLWKFNTCTKDDSKYVPLKKGQVLTLTGASQYSRQVSAIVYGIAR